MEFKSINPFNNNTVGTYTYETDEAVLNKLQKAESAFKSWRKVPLNDRASLMVNAGNILRQNVEEYAKMITLEMGKPITESRA
jgi:succinate-semialdehyde dehydrogenase/glutarate-semialdehyde dehydrogenase